MRKQFEDELNKTREQLEKADKFAEKLPCFEDKILANKYTGEESHINFGSYYKNIYLGWGINRSRYINGTNRTICNYDKKAKYDKQLFNLYFNTLSLYDSHDKHGLDLINEKVKVFYFDDLNSTFYIEDEHIEAFLDEACVWYKLACEQEGVNRKAKEIKELKERLTKLSEE